MSNYRFKKTFAEKFRNTATMVGVIAIGVAVGVLVASYNIALYRACDNGSTAACITLYRR